jgi:hypothetical protein
MKAHIALLLTPSSNISLSECHKVTENELRCRHICDIRCVHPLTPNTITGDLKSVTEDP